MKGWIEIYQHSRLIFKDRIWLWDVNDRSWELNVKSRERQLNLIIDRLIKAMPFYDPDHTKIFVTFKSKMNNDNQGRLLEEQMDDGGGDCGDHGPGNDRGKGWPADIRSLV